MGNVMLCGETSGTFLFKSEIRSRYLELPMLFVLKVEILAHALNLEEKNGCKNGEKAQISVIQRPSDYLPESFKKSIDKFPDLKESMCARWPDLSSILNLPSSSPANM